MCGLFGRWQEVAKTVFYLSVCVSGTLACKKISGCMHCIVMCCVQREGAFIVLIRSNLNRTWVQYPLNLSSSSSFPWSHPSVLLLVSGFCSLPAVATCWATFCGWTDQPTATSHSAGNSGHASCATGVAVSAANSEHTQMTQCHIGQFVCVCLL